MSLTKKIDYSDVLSHVAAAITGGVVGSLLNANSTGQPALAAKVVNTLDVTCEEIIVIISHNNPPNPDVPMTANVFPTSFDNLSWWPTTPQFTSLATARAYFTFNGAVTAAGTVPPINYTYANVGVFPCDGSLASAGSSYQLSDNYQAGYPASSRLEIECPMINPGGGAALSGMIYSNQFTTAPPIGSMNQALLTGSSIGGSALSLSQSIDKKAIIIQRSPPIMKYFGGSAINPSGQTRVSATSGNLTQTMVNTCSTVPQVILSCYMLDLLNYMGNMEVTLEWAVTCKQLPAAQGTVNISLVVDEGCVKDQAGTPTGAIRSRFLCQSNINLDASMVSSQYYTGTCSGYYDNTTTSSDSQNDVWQFLGFRLSITSNPSTAVANWMFGPNLYYKLTTTIPIGEVHEQSRNITVVRNATGLPLNLRREINWFVTPNPDSIAVFASSLKPPVPRAAFEDANDAMLAVYGTSFGAVFDEPSFNEVCKRASSHMGIASMIASPDEKTFSTPHFDVDPDALGPYEALAAPRPSAWLKKLTKGVSSGIRLGQKLAPAASALASMAEGRPTYSTASSRYTSSTRKGLEFEMRALINTHALPPTPQDNLSHNCSGREEIPVPVTHDNHSSIEAGMVIDLVAEACDSDDLVERDEFDNPRPLPSQVTPQMVEYLEVQKELEECLSKKKKPKTRQMVHPVKVSYSPDLVPITRHSLHGTLRALMEHRFNLPVVRTVCVGGTISYLQSEALKGAETTLVSGKKFVLDRSLNIYIPDTIETLIRDFPFLGPKSCHYPIGFSPEKYSGLSVFSIDTLLRLLWLIIRTPASDQATTSLIIEQIMRSVVICSLIQEDTYLVYALRRFVSPYTGQPFIIDSGAAVRAVNRAYSGRVILAKGLTERWKTLDVKDNEHLLGKFDLTSTSATHSPSQLETEPIEHTASSRKKQKLPSVVRPFVGEVSAFFEASAVVLHASSSVVGQVATSLEALADAATSVAAMEVVEPTLEASVARNTEELITELKETIVHKSSARSEGGDTAAGLLVPLSNDKYTPQFRNDRLNSVAKKIKKVRQYDPQLHELHLQLMRGHPVPSDKQTMLENSVGHAHYHHHSMPRTLYDEEGNAFEVPEEIFEGDYDEFAVEETKSRVTTSLLDEQEEEDYDSEDEPAFQMPSVLLDAQAILRLGHLGASYSWGLPSNPLLAAATAGLQNGSPIRFKGINTATFPTIDENTVTSEVVSVSLMTLVVTDKRIPNETYNETISVEGKSYERIICLSHKFKKDSATYTACKNVETFFKKTGAPLNKVFVTVVKDTQPDLPDASISGPSYSLALVCALLGLPSGPVMTGEVTATGDIKAVGQQVTKASHFFDMGIIVPYELFNEDLASLKSTAVDPIITQKLAAVSEYVRESSSIEFMKPLPPQYVFKAVTVREVICLYITGSLSKIYSTESRHYDEIKHNIVQKRMYDKEVASTNIFTALNNAGFEDPSAVSRRDLTDLFEQMGDQEKYKGLKTMLANMLSQQKRAGREVQFTTKKERSGPDPARLQFFKDQQEAMREAKAERGKLLSRVSSNTATFLGPDAKPVSPVEVKRVIKMLGTLDVIEKGGVVKNQVELEGVIVGRLQSFTIGEGVVMDVFMPKIVDKEATKTSSGAKKAQDISSLLSKVKEAQQARGTLKKKKSLSSILPDFE